MDSFLASFHDNNGCTDQTEGSNSDEEFLGAMDEELMSNMDASIYEEMQSLFHEANADDDTAADWAGDVTNDNMDGSFRDKQAQRRIYVDKKNGVSYYTSSRDRTSRAKEDKNFYF